MVCPSLLHLPNSTIAALIPAEDAAQTPTERLQRVVPQCQRAKLKKSCRAVNRQLHSGRELRPQNHIRAVVADRLLPPQSWDIQGRDGGDFAGIIAPIPTFPRRRGKELINGAKGFCRPYSQLLCNYACAYGGCCTLPAPHLIKPQRKLAQRLETTCKAKMT